MTDKAIKALIYCRVSDTKQKIEGSGLKSQEFRCRQHADEKNYDVEAVFRDDVSGGGDYAKRPGMIALLAHLEQSDNARYVVIIDDLKRLARDTMFHLQLRSVMANFGARLECLNYKFDDTPEGEFIETLFAAQGQLERKQTGRQTRQKTKARLEAGYYAFVAPVGYKYIRSKSGGNVIVVDEAVRHILKEAMEGFASGRFQTKIEVSRFLEAAPEFPKTASGKLSNGRETVILRNPLYAGYIEYKPWGVSLRKGQHEGIISYETFLKIQERLDGRAHAPTRKDIALDFPLRGSIACECGNSMTSCYSKSGTGALHAYYLCQNRQCEHKGKSIRRDVIEGEFEELLKTLTPSQGLIAAATEMFKLHWKSRESSEKQRQSVLKEELQKADRDIEQLVDRIVEAESSTVVKALEKRIGKLEESKFILEEKIAQIGRPLKPYDEMYRTAIQFLSKPYKIWEKGGIADKKAVLKLVFKERLI